MEFRKVRLSDPQVVPLLEGLAAEYERRYGPGDEMTSVQAHEFEPPDGEFLILVDNDVVIAGGGLRRLSADACEVKRMWTAPDYRGRGHASAVLDALEQEAQSRGYAKLRLETGPAQPEARRLYESRGYRRIPVYGRYELATAFEHGFDGGSDGT